MLIYKWLQTKYIFTLKGGRIMNIKTYNNKDGWHDAYFDAQEFIEELDEEELLNDKSVLEEDFPSKDRCTHRKNRKNARKAKLHQVRLARSVIHQRNSSFRWNPVWHKKKLSDISPKKRNADNVFTQNAIKEFETI